MIRVECRDCQGAGRIKCQCPHCQGHQCPACQGRGHYRFEGEPTFPRAQAVRAVLPEMLASAKAVLRRYKDGLS